MKKKLFNIVLLMAVLCFIADAILVLQGNHTTPLRIALPLVGMFLIGVGAYGKRLAGD